jgi:hypothetical protein
LTRHYDWSTSDKEGRILRRGIDHAAKLLFESDNPNSVAQLLNAIAGASKAKRDLIESNEIKQIRAEIDELKQLMGIAKKTEIIP